MAVGTSVQYVAQVGALAAMYVAVAKDGLLLATVGAQVTLVWPPTGLALAALRLGGSRLWPGAGRGARGDPGERVHRPPGVPWATACGRGVGTTLEALVAAGFLPINTAHLGAA